MTTSKLSPPGTLGQSVARRRLEARWRTPVGDLAIAEPPDEAVARASRDLAAFYNDPHNSALLSNTHFFSSDEVEQHWRDLRADGGRAFLFTRDGVLVGDGDFRHVGEREAELALLIGPRALQGMGLGRRFALMLLSLGYGELGLERVYVAIRPQNAGSLRLFERVGFVRDETPAARAYAEDDDDVCMVLGRDDFLAWHADAVRQIEHAVTP
jgi:RimJ/RimL family protein N-acetyltransferase